MKRGFTLLEMIVVVSLIALMAAIAIPWFGRLQRENRLSNLTREMLVQVRRARAEASSGRVLDPGPPIVRTRASGVRIVSETQYELFVDPDNVAANGNEVTIDTIDFLANTPNTQVRITSPAADTTIRFRNDGTAIGAQDIVLGDSDVGTTRTIRVNGIGHAKLVN